MDRAERLRRVLSARGLTLYRVSRLSAKIFGRSSRFYIPHNLYSDLARAGLLPTIHQIFALSQITNYRLPDWVSVFGFDLDAIPRLQLSVSRRRTTLLDSSVYDTYAWVSWFSDRHREGPQLPIAPLGQLLAPAGPRRARDLPGLGTGTFLYARVGPEDFGAFPHLAAGSIVRVDTRRSEELAPEAKCGAEKQFFFIEHEFGYTCSRLLRLAKDRVLLLCPACPRAQLELTLGRQARILGIVDAEIRPIADHCCVLPSLLFPAPPRPRLPSATNPQPDLKNLLRISRLRAGLSFREASSISRSIARWLADELYFAAASTLSDYETLSDPPRHIQKILTLCVLYAIDFWQFLHTAGFPLDQAGREPIADPLISREAPDESSPLPRSGEAEGAHEQNGWLGSLLKQWEEVPLFLRTSLGALTGLRNFSLSDVFWVGGERAPLHPWLAKAAFVAVNRRVKRPTPVSARFGYDPPLYLVLRRDGSYLCGPCTLDQEQLVVRSYPGGPPPPPPFRNGADGEVIGKITAILRRLA